MCISPNFSLMKSFLIRLWPLDYENVLWRTKMHFWTDSFKGFRGLIFLQLFKLLSFLFLCRFFRPDSALIRGLNCQTFLDADRQCDQIDLFLKLTVATNFLKNVAQKLGYFWLILIKSAVYTFGQLLENLGYFYFNIWSHFNVSFSKKLTSVSLSRCKTLRGP